MVDLEEDDSPREREGENLLEAAARLLFIVHLLFSVSVLFSSTLLYSFKFPLVSSQVQFNYLPLLQVLL